MGFSLSLSLIVTAISKADQSPLLNLAEENAAVQLQLINTQHAKEQIETDLLQWQNSFKKLQNGYAELEQEKAYLITQIEENHSVLESVHDSLKMTEEKASEMQATIAQKERSLYELSFKLDQCEQERTSLFDRLQNISTEQETAHFEKENFLSEISQLHAINQEAVSLGMTLQDKVTTMNSLLSELQQQRDAFCIQAQVDKRALKRAEGMYRQLSDQFKEKSETLNKTRKELFHAEEQLLKLEKESEENRRFNPSQEELLLEKYILHMDRECSHAMHSQETVINQLHEIIHNLQKCK